jgi:polyhydroxyalkanoate synthesis regulator phasin
MGSALLLREKSQEFVNQAIERGQQIQEEGRKLVQERRAEQRVKRPTPVDPLDVRINNALKRLDVPTAQDIQELNEHIDELSRHIDKLESVD